MRVGLADLTVEHFYKYGYGLLNLTPQQLYSMDSFEFLEVVEGHLAWHEQKNDDLLEWFAWFTANQMVVTGNLKKGTKTEDVRDSLFVSAERARQLNSVTLEDKVKDVQAEKEKLMKRFNLSESQLNSN